MPPVGTAFSKPKSVAGGQSGREIPKGLKPFTFHELKFHNLNAIFDGAEQGTADCPFCGRENRFFAHRDTSQWDCKVCGSSGNSYTFIRKLWEMAVEATQESDYVSFAKQRSLLYPETLKAWGCAISPISGKWILPGFGPDGKLNVLYKWSFDKELNKNRWFVTSTMNHQLCGPLSLLTPNQPEEESIANKGVIYINEGAGDGMVMWETLNHAKKDDDGKYIVTSNPGISLLSLANDENGAGVIAIPGSNVFYESWANILGGKKVVLFYDNDHPRKNPATGQPILPASYAGMKRATEIMSKCEDQPAEIHYIQWGTEDTPYDANLKHGYDIRDLLTKEGDKASSSISFRVGQLKSMFDRVKPVPNDWIVGKGSSGSAGSVGMELIPCSSWKDMINSWRKSMKWTEGLDRALSVMLAVVTSTRAAGDQLWCKIIGPPSCGKSTLCEAISTAKEYILAKSTMRGFHSGYKTDKSGEEDHSLLALVKDKTLITKDGDTLLQSPNFKQILSEARDIYDKTSRTHYRHAVSRDYEGINMTWILCGTSSLREIDQSELGARFFDCIIMEGIDDDLEDEILWRVANRAERIMGQEVNGELESHNDPDMVHTMQITGGYVEYLRKNAATLLERAVMSDEMKRRCMKLGKFVAFMRARPSKIQAEVAEREFGSRLTSQFIRLAKCLAVVLNRDEVDEEVMRRVKLVALDTSRGRVLQVVQYLYSKGEHGALTRQLALHTHETEKEQRGLLRFLAKIKALELNEVVKSGVIHPSRWRLTPKMRALYDSIINAE